MELFNDADLAAELQKKRERLKIQVDHYSSLIASWLEKVEIESKNARQKQQKSLELHHFASFVISMVEQCFFESINAVSLVELTEEPDFILKYKDKLVGFELRRVINKQSEKIGIQKGVLRKAEMLFKTKFPQIDLMVNISFCDNADWDKLDLNQMKEEIAICIFNKHSNIEFEMPTYVASIRATVNTPLSFNLSGSYWVPKLDLQDLAEVVLHKENKIEAYRRQHPEFKELWLLLVIGGASPESDYFIPDEINLHLDTGFDRVFLLNDFKKKVYILK
jgi:hypothetical protein